MNNKKGLEEVVHRFHDLVIEEKNPIIKRYYWKHYHFLFKKWVVDKDIDLILERKS